MRRMVSSVLGLVTLLLPLLAWCKETRPSLPLTEPVQVVISLERTQLHAYGSGFARAMAEAQGGPLLDEISASTSRKSEAAATRAAVSLKDKLADYRFTQAFESALREDVEWRALASDSRIAVITARVTAPFPALGSKDFLLYLEPQYTISSDCKSLAVTLVGDLFERWQEADGSIKAKAVSRRGYSWIYQLDSVKGAKEEDYLLRWSAMDRARLHAMLDQGILRTVDLMNFDYSETGRAESIKTRRGASSAPAPAGARIEQGWVGSLFDNIPGLRGVVAHDWQWPDESGTLPSTPSSSVAPAED